MDGGEEVARGFVIAGGDGAEEFEFGEEIFDQVASLVELFIVFPLHRAVGLGRNHRNLSGLLPGNQNPLVRIEASVGQQDVGLELRQQRIGPFQIASLPTGEMKAGRIAQSIHGSVNLGAQSAFAAPDGLVAAPFFSAPALC